MTCPFFNSLLNVQAGLQNNYVLTFTMIRCIVFDNDDPLYVLIFINNTVSTQEWIYILQKQIDLYDSFECFFVNQYAKLIVILCWYLMCFPNAYSWMENLLKIWVIHQSTSSHVYVDTQTYVNFEIKTSGTIILKDFGKDKLHQDQMFT